MCLVLWSEWFSFIPLGHCWSKRDFPLIGPTYTFDSNTFYHILRRVYRALGEQKGPKTVVNNIDKREEERKREVWKKEGIIMI